MSTSVWLGPGKLRQVFERAARGRVRLDRGAVSSSAEPGAAAGAESRLELSVSAQHRRAHLAVLGQLDHENAAEFGERLEGLIEAGARSLVIDVGGCEIGDSVGLDAIVAAADRARRRRGELVLRAPRSHTLRMLAEAGLTDEIPIC